MDNDNDVDLFDDLEHIIEEKDEENDERNENENLEEDKNEIENTQDIKKDVKKRIVRNPRVKLDATRLCGERGIAILPKTFENVKFKGKGYEKEDLNKLMSTLEHWVFRMYPCVSFDESLQLIEKLGNKAPVKVYLKKLRLDMPLLSEDFINDDDADDKNDENNRDSSEIIANEDKFDQLFRQHELKNQHIDADDTFLSGFCPINYSLSDEYSERESSTFKMFTDEQKERIEKNKRIAKERRFRSKNNNDICSQEEVAESTHVRDEIEKDPKVTVNDGFNEKFIPMELDESNKIILISNNKNYEKEQIALDGDQIISTLDKPNQIDRLDRKIEESEDYQIEYNNHDIKIANFEKQLDIKKDEDPLSIDSEDSDCLKIDCSEND